MLIKAGYRKIMGLVVSPLAGDAVCELVLFRLRDSGDPGTQIYT